MKSQTLGKKRQFISPTFRNVGEVTIPKGAPVFYKPDAAGTVGCDAVSAEALALVNQIFFAGVAMQDVETLRMGDAFGYGIYDDVRVILATRSDNSAVWPSYAAIAVNDLLSVVTETNAGATFQGFTREAASIIQTIASAATNAAQTLTLPDRFVNYLIRAAGTVASATTIASSVGTQLVSSTALRCIIRAF
jgi:hypothetical protein